MVCICDAHFLAGIYSNSSSSSFLMVTDLCLETDCDPEQGLFKRISHKMLVMERQRKDSLSEPLGSIF